ncbi:MAG: oligosaccharide flippase family protein [Deltaproteobacteria bacterium]|nr:oligosaccharide flippase family protein [Deltaproteobacteria bacterium]
MSAPEAPEDDGTAEEPADASMLQKIITETSIFAALSVISSVLAWAANLSLARLLSKRDFGVYGICTFFLGLGSLLGDGGLAAALLRRKQGLDPLALRAAATFAVMVGVVLSLAMALCAPWLGPAYHLTPAETRVLQVMSPLYLVSALRMVPYVRMERALRFSSIARIELAASLVRHVLAIGVAFTHGGVWALVWSNIASALVQLGLAYRSAPGWPGLQWQWKVLRPLLGFGTKVQSLGMLAFVKDNISRALLGKAFGPASVGVFDFGLAYIQLPVLAVNSLARVQLPIYARLNARDPVLFAAVRGALRVAGLLGVPSLICLAIASPWVIPTLYDPKWLPAYPVILGLVANMIAGLAASPLFGLMQGQNQAGRAIFVFAGWTAVTWILSLVSVYVLPRDLGAIAWIYSAVTVAVVAGMFVWAKRLLGRSLFGAVRGPLLAGAASLVMSWLLSQYTVGWSAHPLARAGASLSAYITALVLLEGRDVLREAHQLLRRKTPPVST